MANAQGLSGPLVKAAFLCETVLEEKSGVNSYIRVIDQIGIETVAVRPPGTGPELPTSIPPGAEVAPWLVLMFTASGARGRHTITVRLRPPSGLISDVTTPIDLIFDARHTSGANIHANLRMAVDTEGPYTVIVFMDRNMGNGPEEITQVPFEITYRRT